RAAGKGHLRAQEFLANAYESGKYGLGVDAKKSRFWANKAGLE
ncbi:MAG: sel1 repeat family protein, partial [Gammaproteobacteria bacterium]